MLKKCKLFPKWVFLCYLAFKSFLLFLTFKNVYMYLKPDQFWLCLQNHGMWIAVFLTILRSACTAPQDLGSLEAHRKTLQLSGHGAVLRCSQDCTVALQPSPLKRKGFPFTSVIRHRECSAAPKPPHTCIPWHPICVLFHAGAFHD